jgi:biopolymer transport protein ExbD
MVMQRSSRKGLAGQVVRGMQRRGGPGIGLRMTAMIDVVFLLLTFFVLTSKFQKPEAQLPVVMPKPSTEPATEQHSGPMKIQLKAAESGCAVVIADADAIPLQEQTLDAGLAAVTAGFQMAAASYNIAENGLELHCEDAVQWDYVVKVYDILYRQGATKITFITQKP